MTDKYQRLRDALDAGPTPGPWEAGHESCSDFRLIGAGGVYIISGCGCCGSPSLDSGSGDADATYIAAACPDTIAELLAERDALREALVIARDYVASEVFDLRIAYRGYESHGKVPEAEADLARIDDALGDANAHP